MTPTIEAYILRFPGNFAGLATAMGCERQAVWHLRCGMHRKRHLKLLRGLAAAFASAGTVDGSPVPDLAELVRAWDAERAARA